MSSKGATISDKRRYRFHMVPGLISGETAGRRAGLAKSR
jgi:hypothetical protein